MPKYRQLHTKIIDSFDFNEIPNDFTRVVWLLLTLILDSEGRGIDNPSWVKSKMFPMRPDVSEQEIKKSFDWLDKRKMIVRYKTSNHNYFYVPTFKTYQTGTNKEAKSVLPAPELLQSLSEPYQEKEKADCIVSASEYESAFESEYESDENKKMDVVIPDHLNTPEFITKWGEWVVFRKEIKKKMTPTIQEKQLKKLSEYSPGVAAAMLEQSMVNGWTGLFPIKNNDVGAKYGI